MPSARLFPADVLFFEPCCFRAIAVVFLLLAADLRFSVAFLLRGIDLLLTQTTNVGAVIGYELNSPCSPRRTILDLRWRRKGENYTKQKQVGEISGQEC